MPPSSPPSSTAMPSSSAAILSANTSVALRYNPLTAPKHSIRIAILHPGKRQDALKVTTQEAKFADRPQYFALSYAWGKPSDVKFISLDGREAAVRINLHAALLQLRDESELRHLWIDAICINQSDIEERNQQVAIMAYIYARAQMVIVWLGVLDASAEGRFEPCWGRACEQSYWQRLWIVQEIGAAAAITVEWEEDNGRKSGTNPRRQSHSWDDFFTSLKKYRIEAALPYKLYDQRRQRYGDSFQLANLVKACQESLCEDPRDKIYGLVGIAHDCQGGKFPIDYSKSYYEVYQDTMRFYHSGLQRGKSEGFATLPLFSQVVHLVLGGVEGLDRDLKERDIAHKPFQQSTMSEDNTNDHEIITISGLACGAITDLGPTYDSILADPSAWSSWKALLSECTGDAETLRRKNELFMRALVNLPPGDLPNVAAVNTKFSFPIVGPLATQPFPKDTIFPVGFDTLYPPNVQLEPLTLHPSTVQPEPLTLCPPFVQPEPLKEEKYQYQLFTTGSGVIGLAASSNTKIGDILVQFVHTDVVAVLRLNPDMTFWWQIVGRAIIFNGADNGSWKCNMPPQEDNYDSILMPVPPSTFAEKLTALKVDMMTLHLLTC